MKQNRRVALIVLLMLVSVTAITSMSRGATCSSSLLYWVGGSGSATQTAHWSPSSGGTSGCLPDHVDVIFDSASGSGNVTVATTVFWHSLTITPSSSMKIQLSGSGQIVIGGITYSGGLPNGGMDILNNAVSAFYIIVFFVVLGLIVTVAWKVRQRL